MGLRVYARTFCSLAIGAVLLLQSRSSGTALNALVCSFLVQVNLPVGEVDDAPIGISLMAKHGADRFLLDTVSALHATVQEEAKVPLPTQTAVSVANGKTHAAEIAKEKVTIHLSLPVFFFFMCDAFAVSSRRSSLINVS